MGRGAPDKVAFDKTWKGPCLTLGGWWGSYLRMLSVGPGPDSSRPGCPDGSLRYPIGPSVGKDNYNVIVCVWFLKYM